MMSWISVLAMAAAFQAPDAPSKAAKPAVTPVPVAEADWAKRPSREDMARFYPERATREGVGGDVSLACAVVKGGALSGCKVSIETPQGYGFGEAALKLVETYAIRPERAAVWVTSDRQVLVPVRFRPDASQAPGVERLPPGFVPRDGRVPLPRRERT